jgi:hypothetical protein
VIVAAAVALLLTPLNPARADESARLLVGSVRDQTGQPIAAEIVAFTRDRLVAGRGRTAADGTFALALSAPALSLAVSCVHCAPLRVALGADAPLALIVTRYLALDQSAPDDGDLQALPYDDVGDAAGLARFVIPIASGARIASLSDRGLERGRGLILDEGVPVYDPSTGEGTLFAYPAHSTGALHVAPASRAFTYGSYAGGGAFALSRFADEPDNVAAFDAGPSPAVAFAAKIGSFLPAIARSRDYDGVERRRADLGLATSFAGGTLRADAGFASQHPDRLSIAEDRSRELASVSYATASRLSRTFLGASAFADRGAFLLRPGGAVWGNGSSALEADARVEHPATIELDFGGTLRAASGAFSVGATNRSAHYSNALGYVEASHAGSLSYRAGIALAGLAISPALYSGAETAKLVVLPAASVAADLGGGFRFRAGGSTALRAPTLLEIPAAMSGLDYSVERSNLLETALSYDDARRIQVETTAYRQQASGLGGRTLNGVGFGLAWQIAPRLSLRAWTLHDASNDTGTTLLVAPYAVLTGPSIERDVIWASYETPGGVRADAIMHHSTLPLAAGANLDADLLVPLAHGFALNAGSAQRMSVRRSYLGLRFQKN